MVLNILKLRLKAVMHLCAFVLCAVVFCGCATQRRHEAIERALRDLETEQTKAETATQEGGDAPDAPVDHLPVLFGDAGVPGGGGKLTIQKDCLLHITVEEDPGLDGSYPVNDIGAVLLGYIGPVMVGDKTEKQAEQKISNVLVARDFRKATVRVRIQRASYDKVRVEGVVRKPGLLQIGPGDAISLNDALIRVGTLSVPAHAVRVRIVRGGETDPLSQWRVDAEEYDLTDEDGRPAVPNVFLRNNDVAYVRTKHAEPGEAAPVDGGKVIVLLGEVRRPGPIRFSSEESCTVLHLIWKVGGFPPFADMKKLQIVRRDSEGNETEHIVNAKPLIERGRPEDDFELESGDRVIVPARMFRLY